MALRGNAAQQAQMQAMQMQMQMEQMSFMQKTFARARSSCWKKCIHGFAENELGAAESACIERCVLKYIEVQQLLSGRMAMTGQAMEEQMRAAGGQMPGMPPK